MLPTATKLSAGKDKSRAVRYLSLAASVCKLAIDSRRIANHFERVAVRLCQSPSVSVLRQAERLQCWPIERACAVAMFLIRPAVDAQPQITQLLPL